MQRSTVWEYVNMYNSLKNGLKNCNLEHCKCYFKTAQYFSSTLQKIHWHFLAHCALVVQYTMWTHYSQVKHIDDLFDILVVGQIVYYLCICAGSRHVAKCAWIYDASKGGPSTQFFGQPLRPFGEKLKHVALGFVWPDPASLNYEAR